MRNLTRREYLLVVLFALVVGFVLMRGCDKKRDVATASTELRPGVVEKIVINPDTHKLTVTTSNGTQESYLPDRPSSIELGRNGKLTVTSRQFGTELKLFIGGQLSNEARLAVGVDGLYYKKLDLGLGVACRPGNYTPVAFVQFSYNVWSNLKMGLTYDSGNHIGASLTVRL